MDNEIYIVKEMMFGSGDKFEYFKCSNCGCLQLSEIPQNISKYYPENYYSFGTVSKQEGIIYILKKLIRYKIIKGRLESENLISFIFSRFLHRYYWLFKELCTYDSNILDIGCGNGILLMELKALGFKNLKGLDPFISVDINYPNGVSILKKEVEDIDEKFDLIMLHHSFEHMKNPREVLRKISNCLNPNAFVLIRIPVVSSYAFRRFGVNWVQLDAPRHFFLHTPASIKFLADQTDFMVVKTVYDSTSFQFLGSINYENNLTWEEGFKYSKTQRNYFEKVAQHLNKINDGDSACFYLRKRKS
jgi:SAM-dependent methyltransferase